MPGNPSLHPPSSTFAPLDERQVAEVTTMFESRSYSKGETFFEIGDKVETMYLIRRGRVQLFVENNLGERVILRELGPGDLFGEPALLDGGTNPFTALATEDSQAMTLRREDLAELLARFPGTSIAMMTALCRQLRSATSQLGEQNPSTIEDRMAQGGSIGNYLADNLAYVAGSPRALAAFSILLAIAIILSRVPLPWITGSSQPLDQGFDTLNLGLTILEALQCSLILLVLNRTADRNRLKEDIDFQFEAKLESRLAQMKAKIDSNQQEIRQLLAESKAQSAGSRPSTRAPS